MLFTMIVYDNDGGYDFFVMTALIKEKDEDDDDMNKDCCDNDNDEYAHFCSLYLLAVLEESFIPLYDVP